MTDTVRKAIARRKAARLEKLYRSRRATREREKKAAAKSALAAQAADGLCPSFRAQLHEACKRAENDPRAKALVARAELSRRIRDARKAAGIDRVVPADAIAALEPVAQAAIPVSVAERRKARKQ